MENIKLSRRMMMNADMIKKCRCIADIGCDHAYVSVWLCMNNRADKVIAMDVNEGPLDRARENIRKYNMQDRIEVRLSDGTEMLRESEADAILIAGMGGMLMMDILSAGRTVLKECSQIVLQPQSDIHKVRGFIRENGFAIDCEDMVLEDGKYYTSIHAINLQKHDDKTDGVSIGYNTVENELFDRYGEYLLKNSNLVLKEMLLHRRSILLNSIKMVKNSENNNIEVLNGKIKLIEEGLEYYGM